MSRAGIILEKSGLVKKILHPIKSKEDDEKEEEEEFKDAMRHGESPIAHSLKKRKKGDERIIH